MIQIRPVVNQKDWKDFIDLPWKIYEGDPNWVPPLRIAVREILDVNKNPFFKHSYMKPILAVKDNEVVGRIVGIIDENHNKVHQEKTGFFGFFECINQADVAQALVNEVNQWVKEWGMQTLRGPVNPSLNAEAALLVEGFDDPPLVMTTYNPPYYADLLESCGFSKAKDFFAYRIASNCPVHGTSKFSERLVRQCERLAEKSHIKFRSVDMKNFSKEAEAIKGIYNDAWSENWGFVPMEDDEFDHMVKELKMVLDPRLIIMAEVRGEPVAFGVALPDINQVFKKIPDGRLLPTGLLKLLWNLKGLGRKKTITRCRVIILGVKKEYMSLGLGPLLFNEYFRVAPIAGVPEGEASWILEDNKQMNKAARLMGGELTKRWRIYDRSTAASV